MRFRTLAGMLLAVALLAGASASASARSTHGDARASSSYPDGSGDGSPDIAAVDVSDDASGTITFTVTYNGETCLGADEALSIALDTVDGGEPFGLDYVIALDSSGVSLHSTTNTGSPVPSSTLKHSCGQGDSIAIGKGDIGVGASFRFQVTTTGGDEDDSLPDDAVTGGLLTYTLSGASNPPPPPPPPPPPAAPPGSPPAPPPAGALNASFGADKPPHLVGQPVRFDAATFGYASYQWAFGDGKTQTTKVPLALHRYSAAGTYVVTLTVTDGAGKQGQSSISVTVDQVKPWGDTLPVSTGPGDKSRQDPVYGAAARRLARAARSVFCWDKADWAILQPVFDTSRVGAFVDPSKPREINLGPRLCARLDLVRSSSRPAPTLGLASALFTFAREVELSARVKDPAAATCYALQLVPRAAQLLGAGARYATRLGVLLASWLGPGTAPAGAWSSQCHDGGRLDLDPAHAHWP